VRWATWRGGPRRAAWALAAAAVPAPALADLWSFDSSVETRLEINDNVTLSQNPAGSVTTLALSSSSVAARRIENAATRLSVDLSLLDQRGPGSDDRVDGRLALAQTYTDALRTLALTGTLAQDFNSDLIGADVTQARGRRRTAGLSGSWSHAVSERASLSAQFSASRTGYGQSATQASDFRDASVSGGAGYQLSEVSSATVQVRHSRYRALSGASQSITDSVDMGLSRSLFERASASASVGAYRTRSTNRLLGLACPLPLSFCESGLVSYVVVERDLTRSRRGAQFSASSSWRADEIGSLTFSVSSQQSPSGAGVVRSDNLSVGATRPWSPTLNLALNYGHARSTQADGDADVSSGQRTLLLSLVRQLSPQLSLQAGYRRTLADRLAGGAGAASTSVYASLKYDWVRLETSR
jgi:hypothetical protein